MTHAPYQVYKALRGGVGEVAVKVLSDTSGSVREGCRREIAVLKRCHDRHVVQFFGACVSKGRTMMVTEYMEGGDLRQALSADVKGEYKWRGSRGKAIALDISRGLAFLHDQHIIHFDLKSCNVLLGPGGAPAKIADVGLAVMLGANAYVQQSQIGTFAWAAPEVLMGKKCSEKADIFSLGVVLWEIVTGEEPARGQLRDALVPSESPPDLDALISRCVDPEPRKRPSAKEVYHALRGIESGPLVG